MPRRAKPRHSRSAEVQGFLPTGTCRSTRRILVSHSNPAASCRSSPSNGYSCRLHSNPAAYSHRHTPSCRIPHPVAQLHPLSRLHHLRPQLHAGASWSSHTSSAQSSSCLLSAAPRKSIPLANIISLIGITAPPSPNSGTSSSRTSSYLIIRTDIPDHILLSGRLSVKTRLGCAQFHPVVLASTGATCSAASFGGHGLARHLRLAR